MGKTSKCFRWKITIGFLANRCCVCVLYKEDHGKRESFGKLTLLSYWESLKILISFVIVLFIKRIIKSIEENERKEM